MSLIANVGVLAVFKYYNFFIGTMNDLLHGLGIATGSIPLLGLILPIGLSFHTFQAMSYTIEVYRGNQPAERHLGIYSLYVMFYPQLVAGPIERPQNLLGQFREVHRFDAARMMDGLRLMLWGFFKKLVIADRLAVVVNGVFAHPGQHNAVNLALATFFFSIQIYCDFSGYSDIAIGAARTMGFDLMTNFNRPYFARNIHEFWSRWHISLSTWFRDYLYIPLGGNRVPRARRYVNVAVVFLVSGLWHGANWTFVLWGAMHATLVMGYMFFRELRPRKPSPGALGRAASVAVTFVLVSLAWVFFRADTVGQAFTILGRMLTLDMGQPDFGAITASVAHLKLIADPVNAPRFFVFVAFLLALLFGVERYASPDMTTFRRSFALDAALGVVTLALIIVLGVFSQSAFIYFQF
jgi:D-alanyl-lipoteichoic acid acyltransferase DltB (MBOAT superfamily)